MRVEKWYTYLQAIFFKNFILANTPTNTAYLRMIYYIFGTTHNMFVVDTCNIFHYVPFMQVSKK